MKIAIVCYPTHGGSGVVAAELGMELARREHEVHFVSYQMPFRLDPLQSNITFHEVQVTAYPLFRYPPYTLELATRLVQVIRNHGVQILHVHYAIPHAISAVLARQMCSDCDIRIITTLHGTDITLVGDEPNYREITRYGIEQSDAVTAVSEYLARATRERLGVTRHIDVVPNFVDMERYSPERRDAQLRARFAEPDERLLVHVSNFREVKRVPDVIDVFTRVQKQLPARLLMVGNGPERPAAEAELERRGLGGRVSFVGPVDEVGELLACGDLMLLPSQSESFGLVALESMACGVPVVATRSGGLPELVEDGVTGILAEVGAVDVMAARALDLLRDPGAHTEMGQAARRQVADRFPSPRIVEAYLELYDRVS